MSIINGLGDLAITGNEPAEKGAGGELVSWVMSKVQPWREERDSAYREVWGEYYRLWRGRHIESDRSRDSERSKLVSPALAQALEMTVSELEEATFGREQWVDIIDDAGDPDHQDINGLRRMFIEDMEEDHVPDAVAASYLNGGLWGTLAAKVVVEKSSRRHIVTVPELDPVTQEVIGQKREIQDTPHVSVSAVPIPPDELIIDPEGQFIDEMLGVAHECRKSPAWLLTKPWGRKYANRPQSSRSNSEFDVDMGRKDKEDIARANPKSVLITEWHGKVPARFLKSLNEESERQDEPEDLLEAARIDTPTKDLKEKLDGERMVEAIVTIFDEKFLGRAIENPFLMKDRSIVACPFERVPGRFWGRGVMEKGYNPQKALDAELRTRMDVMALLSNPQMGVDQTALPRGYDLRVRPGKVWSTNGNPKEALFPVVFPGLDPASFSQTSEMERMVQIGTGAMDTATPLAENRRNETATGTSLIAGTFVKRAKRALRTITANFTQPLVEKILLRRMEFDPSRYPGDTRFRVTGTLGIVARELEQAQMGGLLQSPDLGPQTRATLVKSLFDASNSPYKAELNAALAADSQPTQEQQAQQQMQMQSAQLQLQNQQLENATLQIKLRETEADIVLKMAKVQSEMAKIGRDDSEASMKVQAEFARLSIELEEVRQFARQNDNAELKIRVDAARGTNSNGQNEGRQNSTNA